MDVEKIRKDFPLLRSTKTVYLDSACMSLRPDPVLRAIQEYYTSFPACTGRSSHRLAHKALSEVDKARDTVRRYLGARRSREIIFTRNSTEGINFIARSLKWEPGDTVITSDREHNSNLLPWLELKKHRGIEHKVVRSEPDERFDPTNLRATLAASANVKLVSIVHTSNLDGYTLPIEQIIDISHRSGALVLVDGAQSAPHREINLARMKADFFVMSSHKACGPSGMGCLFVREELLDNLDPFLTGGGTVDNAWYDRAEFAEPPGRFEAGLQDVAGICGFAKACDYIDGIGRENIERRERDLVKWLTDGLGDIPNVEFVGVRDHPQKGGVVNFNILGMDCHEVAQLLDETKNIMVRSGMHCMHPWFNSRGLGGSVRASVYFYNSDGDVEMMIECVRDIARLAGRK